MKKKDGFPGQISFVIPERILALITGNALIADLYITDIGYYPQARHHYRERPSGSMQYILIYCVEGEGEIRTNNTAQTLGADQFYMIREGVPHAYRSDGQKPWSIYWIHFAGSKADAYARFCGQVHALERSRTSRTNDRIELFSEIFRNLDRGFSLETLEYVNQCLPHLLASFTHLSQFRLIMESGEKDPLARSINYMLENLTKKLKLYEIATETGLSASHLSRLFTSRTGHAPIEYFIQLKMQRACRLLDNSGWTVADVARETGFEDPFYFSRVFRKVMGMSPNAYRKRVK